MFFTDITVDVPQAKRIQKPSGCVYEILHRKGKDYDKDKVICVGKLVSDSKMNPNEKYFDLHPEVINDSTELPQQGEFSNNLHLGLYIIIKKGFEDLGLKQLIDKHFPGKFDLILSLCNYYLLRRESASQLYKYFATDHFTGMNYIPSDTELSNFLNYGITRENITPLLTDILKKSIESMGKDAQISVDFDSTNFNASSPFLQLSEFGQPKVDEGIPQVNVAYFLNRKTGLPIYYDIYYGSIIDMNHCKTAIDKIKEIASAVKIQFVMDRGYFSQSNIEYIANNGYEFVCLGKKNDCFSKYVRENPPEVMKKSSNRIKQKLYGIKFKDLAFKESKNNFYVYLIYNEQEALNKGNDLQDEIESLAKLLIGKKDEHEKIRKKNSRFMNIIVDKDFVITHVDINYDEVDRAKEEKGYFWIVSNINDNVENIYHLYAQRDVVEKNMMYVKSGCDLIKDYAQSDEMLESKTLLGFLCSCIKTYILEKTKPYRIQYSCETSETVMEELDKIVSEKYTNKYIKRFSISSEQKQILSYFGYDKNIVDSSIKELNQVMELVNC